MNAGFLNNLCGYTFTPPRFIGCALILAALAAARPLRAEFGFGAPAPVNQNAYTDEADTDLFAISGISTPNGADWIAVWDTNGSGDSQFGTDFDMFYALYSQGEETTFNPAWTAPAALNTNAATDTGDDGNLSLNSLEGDGAGNWLALWSTNEPALIDPQGRPAGGDLDVVCARSTDGGQTWTQPVLVNGNAGFDTGADLAFDIKYDGSGTWIAAWQSNEPALGGSAGGDADEFDVFTARSTNLGTTWSSPAPLKAGSAFDSISDIGPRLATDRSGRWVAVWTETDDTVVGVDSGRILAATSNNNGNSWSNPLPIDAGAPAGAEGFTARIDTGRDGDWVCVWASRGRFSAGENVPAVSRSTNNGADWSAPEAVHPLLISGGGSAYNPEIAAGAPGEWLVVWQGAAPGLGGDFDILGSLSMDGGLTWTAPGLVNTNAANDEGGDIGPRIATDRAGRWIVTWTSTDSLGGTIGTDADILFAATSNLGEDAPPAPVSLAAVADTHINEKKADKNEGSSSKLLLDDKDPGRILVKFDGQAILDSLGGAGFASARLGLLVEKTKSLPPEGLVLNLHRMTQDWTEAGATWNQGRPGAPWSMADADPELLPYAAAPLASVTLTAADEGQWIEFDVTQGVGEILADDATNFGWLLKKENEALPGEVTIKSCQHPDMACAPRLEVVRFSWTQDKNVLGFAGEGLLNGYSDLSSVLHVSDLDKRFIDDQDPQMATDGYGNWIMVWASLDNSHGFEEDHFNTADVFFSVRRRAGSWSEPKKIYALGGDLDMLRHNESPRVASDSAQPPVWIVTWASRLDVAQANDQQGDIYTARSTDFGANWNILNMTETLPPPGGQTCDAGKLLDFMPDIAANQAHLNQDSTWVLVWASGCRDRQNHYIRYTASSDSGLTWDTMERHLPEIGGQDGHLGINNINNRLSLATDGSNWMVAWSDVIQGAGVGQGTRGIRGAVISDPVSGSLREVNSPLASLPQDTDKELVFPQLSADTMGNWIVVYHDDTSALNARVRFSKFTIGQTGNEPSISVHAEEELPCGTNPNTGAVFCMNQYPTIATDGTGMWFVAAESRAAGIFGETTASTDSDILISRSTNAGISWEGPFLLNMGGPGGTINRNNPAIESDGGCYWLAAWEGGHSVFPQSGEGSVQDIHYSENFFPGSANEFCNPAKWRSFEAEVPDANLAFTRVNSFGLCMGVPGSGDNVALWATPETSAFKYDLVDDRLYRLILNAETTQTTENAIPLLNVLYVNLPKYVYGGEAWLLDVAGGANGIGRAVGRGEYTFYFCPNAALTSQWKDPFTGALTSAADAVNDFGLMFRVNDPASANINAAIDSGIICISDVRIDGFPLANFLPGEELYSASLGNDTHAAVIDDVPCLDCINDEQTNARFTLNNTSSSTQRASLFPFDPSMNNGVNFNRQLYPVVWESDILYMTAVEIRSDISFGFGSIEGSDPVDTIYINMDTPTVELGQSHYTSRGAPGSLHMAASPRLSANTGGEAQTYIGFMNGQNVSLNSEADSARLRGYVEFINSDGIAGHATGTDPFAVESLRIVRINPPHE